jgi:molybdenum cofactor cytidylyltransferase
MSKAGAVAAVILAAGTASRYRAEGGEGATKLIAEVDGKPMVRHVVNAAMNSEAFSVVVVTGHARDAVENALMGLPVQVRYNADYDSGIASSLRNGVLAAGPSVRGAIVMLGDMPRVTPELLNKLIEAFGNNPNARAVVPVFGGQRGNPVLLSKKIFGEVAKLTGDMGARKLLEGDGEVIEVPVDDVGVALDIDTPAALEELRRD